MIHEVRAADSVYHLATERFGEQRTVEGAPSEYDFVAGPLAAAIFAFRDFENLSYDVVSSVRTYTIVDPFFGPVVFVAVRVAVGIVEIVGFSDDPDYWTTIDQDPE